MGRRARVSLLWRGVAGGTTGGRPAPEEERCQAGPPAPPGPGRRLLAGRGVRGRGWARPGGPAHASRGRRQGGVRGSTSKAAGRRRAGRAGDVLLERRGGPAAAPAPAAALRAYKAGL